MRIKLTIFALVMGVSLAFAQRVSLSFNQVPMQTVFSSIRQQTGMTVSYSRPSVNPDQIVSIEAENEELTDVLNRLFKDLSIAYKIEGKTILLSKQETVAPIQVTGVIKDAQGEPIIGATIQLEGSTTGTITDFDGNFTIKAAPKSALNISYVGFKSQRVIVKDANPISVTLTEDTELLEEVVVIGYGAVRKSDLTGSVASVKTDELNQTSPSLEQSLVGHTPGVEIKQTSGAPGSSATIHIRGVNSVYGDVEPLYVIDGFPASKDVYINPSDVESIEILKDAASAAIYGSRAAGGVVLITTKRGQKDKINVNVDYQFSMQQLQKKIKLMNSAEFKKLHQDGYNNCYFDFLRNNAAFSDKSLQELWEMSRDPDNNNRKLNGATNTMLLCPDIVDSDYDTDWQDALFSNAPMHKVNFSVSGGTGKNRFMFSLGYLNQDGIVSPGNHQRLTSRLNVDFDVTKRFTIGVNTNMYYVKERTVRTDGLAFNDGIILNTLCMPTTYPVYNEDGTYAVGISYKNGANDATGYQCFGGENPVALANERQEYYTKMRYSINTNFQYTFLEGFFAKLNAGVQIADQIYNLYRPFETIGNSNFPPGDSYGDAANTPDLLGARDNRDFNTDWLLEATLNYNKVVKEKHTINAVLGYSMQKKVYNNLKVGSVPGAYVDDRIQTLAGAQATAADANGTKVSKADQAAWAMMSVFGRVMYNYDSRYTLSVSMRGDGCSRFGTKNRWGFFPSVSGGWNITNEQWAVDAQRFVTAKLRASWGISGNNNIGNYKHIAMVTSGAYVFGGQNYVTYYPTAADANLGWEKTNQTNIGADLTFLSGRLSLIANYYYSVTSDLLYQTTTSALTGETSMWTNLKDGRVYNQGGDIAFDANIIQKRDWKWNLGVNFSLNRNKVEGLSDEILTVGQRKKITHITTNGQPIGSFYGMKHLGLITEEDYAIIREETSKLNNGDITLADVTIPVADRANVYVGDVKWKDVNGDGKITEDDREILGNNYPKFSFGFNTSVSWKGLTLSANFDGSFGNKVINFARYYACNNEGGCNSLIQAVNRYGNVDQVDENTMFRANRSQKNLNTAFSDYFVEDASFLRMTNLMIGYTIPDNEFFKKIHMERFYLYFSVDNVFTATKYTGYNPDVDYNASNLAPGIDFGTYPLSRSFSGGIKLTF